MITFIIIWFILHIGVWVCKIDKFINRIKSGMITSFQYQ